MTTALRRSVILVAAAACAALAACPAREEGSDLEPMGPPGLPADSFPGPGRAVADIVSPVRQTEAKRDSAGEARRIIERLGISAGAHVADVGAGSGYYAVRIARVVGDSGRVLAQDVMPRYLGRLGARLRRENLRNVVLALGEPHDPRLPTASVDLALLAHMYHEVEQPYAFLHNLAPALRPGGRVAILDLEREPGRHGVPLETLRCEAAAVGYELTESHREGEEYLAVFRVPAPAPAAAEVRRRVAAGCATAGASR